MMDCDMDNITLKNSAVQNESTLNPPTILSQNKMIKALITNKNRPNVTKVIGKVNTNSIGLTKTLSSPRTSATIKAVVKPAT
jgi:hypothetical protein